MSEIQELWAALLVRWAFVSAATLGVRYLYVHHMPHPLHWIATTMLWTFWLNQVLHLLFFIVLGLFFLTTRRLEKQK